MLKQLGGDTSWPARLRELIRDRPNVPLSSMGFPEDWEGSAYWGFEEEAAIVGPLIVVK